MKKIVFLIFCFFALISLSACNDNGNTDNPIIEPGGSDEEKPNDNENKPNDNENENKPNDNENENKPNDNENNGSVVDVAIKEKRELYICIPEDRDLKVLQFADIHFGVEGKDWHNDKVDRTKQFMLDIIENDKPDLIVCSGDNILQSGTTGVKEFVDLMESYQIPWIWLYGNHDSESNVVNFRKRDLSKCLMECNTEYLLYKEGYIEEGIENRYGNFSVSVYNETKDKLLGGLIILDSGEHDYDKGEYQAITEGQISWYKNEIDKLQETYSAQNNNAYEIIPTIVFAHIQLPEFYTAYNKALINDGAKFVVEQSLSSDEITEIKTGGPNVNTGLFDAMVEKGSTKAYFVGHAHTFYFQVEMNGIVLGFGPQVGFSKLFPNNDAPRKVYIYNLAKDFTFTTTKIDEIVRDKGLVYSGTTAGHAKYNESNGTYTFTVQLPLWGRVKLDYYGDDMSSDYVTLSLDNTNVTGEINSELAADWTTKLYCTTSDSGIYLCSSSQNKIYRFTYTVATNTLHIELVGELDIESGSITAIKVNRDSEISVWKKEGYQIITNSKYATADGRRLFIIVDKEGRIAYAVYNHGQSDAGNPLSEDMNYYVNPYYNDNENPAIKITDTGYEIVIPEGGFAITAEKDGVIKLVNLLLNPAIKELVGIEKIVNNSESFKSSLRIYFDPDTKVISTSFVE